MLAKTFMRANCSGRLLLLSVILATGSRAATAYDVSGQWQSGTVIGPQSMPDRPGCVVYTYMERTALFNPVPGRNSEIRGVWRRHQISFWLDKQAGHCSWPQGGGQSDSYESTFVFTIDGTFDPAKQMLRIVTTYVNCFGNACEETLNKSPAIKDPVEQTLVFSGNSLKAIVPNNQEAIVCAHRGRGGNGGLGEKAATDVDKLLDQGAVDQLIRNYASSFVSISGP